MKKVFNMKVAQFFKTYNFHVVQVFTRPKDLKLFWNPLNFSFANKHDSSFKIRKGNPRHKNIFYEGKSEKQEYAF